MKRAVDLAFIFGLGGSVYCLLETLWRGYSHWTMGLLGGLALLILYLLACRLPRWPLAAKALAGAAIITALELVTGLVVNVALGWQVWNYADQPLNLAGQICPAFSLLWFLLCLPAFGVCTFIRRYMESDAR